MEKVSERYVKKLVTVRSIFFAIVAIVFAFMFIAHLCAVLFGGEELWILLIWAIPGFLLVVFLAVYAFIFPKLVYKNLSYTVSDDRVEIRRGFIFKTRCIFPILRVQHVELFEGVFDRIYKLAVLKVDTAGASCSIMGLDREKAYELAEILKHKLDKKIIARQEKEYAD